MTAGLENPNFLAGYLLLIWPLALGLLVRAKNRFSKTLWSLLLIVSLVALFFTGSKAGWLGFAAGILVFLILNLKNGFHNLSPWVFLPIAFLVFSLSFSPISKNLQKCFPLANRIPSGSLSDLERCIWYDQRPSFNGDWIWNF